MKQLVESILYAGAIYDEDGFAGKVKQFFPSARIDTEINETDFWAVIIRDESMDIALRGTDGVDSNGKRLAWKRNFQTAARPDGTATGFGNSADAIFDDIDKKYCFRDFKQVKLHGHSAGAAETPILGARITREYHIHGIECFAWASPPSGTRRWAVHFNALNAEFGLHSLRIVNPRDIVTVVYRDGDVLTAGEDVGGELRLPEDGWLQRLLKKIPGVWEHSPREHVDGAMTLLKNDPVSVSELKIIRKMMVN
jgi:hypothetical protein